MSYLDYETKTSEARAFILSATPSVEFWRENGGTCAWIEVPEHTRQSIMDYLNRDYAPSPGTFLRAVLTNNLRDAVILADDRNRRKLPEIVMSFYQYAPAGVWGSDERVKEFLSAEEKELAGRES